MLDTGWLVVGRRSVGERGSFLAYVAVCGPLLGAEQLVAVETLYDVVGDPDIDVAAGRCDPQTDLLPADRDDSVAAGSPGDPFAVSGRVRTFDLGR